MDVYNKDTTYENNTDFTDTPSDQEGDADVLKNCTNQIAKDYNITTKDGELDTSIITTTDQKRIWKKEYSLCNIDDKGDYYYNCALNNKNIWLTQDPEKKDNCIINPHIVLAPNKLEKEPDIHKLKKPEKFTAIKSLNYDKDSINILCSERWYDWFTIPDYHNDNKYTNETDSVTGGEICFKPCKFGMISTSNTKDSSAYLEDIKNKCISRDLIDNGRLKNTLLFTPYAIIFLLGSTKHDLIELYKYEISNIKSIVDDYHKNNPSRGYDLEINNNVFKQITENTDTSKKIIDDLKETIRIPIKQLITEPISHLNIIPPHDNLSKLNNKPKKYYNNEKYIKKAYEIATKLYKYLTDISLKNDFYLYKKSLEEINGFEINSWEFNKILLLLQASCMLCFGYQNPKDILYKKQKEYNEYVMKNIFKFNDNNNVFDRINYPRITNSQILKSIDTNNPFNNMNDTILNDIKSSKIKEYQLSQSSIDLEIDNEIDKNFLILNMCNVNFKKTDGTIITKVDALSSSDIESCVNEINIEMIDNGFSSFLINMLNCFFVIIVIILFIFMSYLLLILIWPSFANVINYAIFGFIWIFAVFIGTFQSLYFKVPNSKGIIMEIHRVALKGEFLFDQFMRTLAVIGAKNDMFFYLLFAMTVGVIFAVIFKSLFDLVQIFIADSAINSSSNKSTNSIKYVFSC